MDPTAKEYFRRHEAPSNPPCAACKTLRRKCANNCVFAPHFKSDNMDNFIAVHKVYGASNVGKLLGKIPMNQRENAVKSLVYEAQCRLTHPVYGSVGLVSVLQQQYRQIQAFLASSKQELASYEGPPATSPPVFGHQQQSYGFGPTIYEMMPNHMQQMIPIGQQQQMQSNFGLQKQQNNLGRFTNDGFGDVGGFNQMQMHDDDDDDDDDDGPSNSTNMPPYLSLGGSYEEAHPYQLQLQQNEIFQQLQQQQQQNVTIVNQQGFVQQLGQLEQLDRLGQVQPQQFGQSDGLQSSTSQQPLSRLDQIRGSSSSQQQLGRLDQIRGSSSSQQQLGRLDQSRGSTSLRQLVQLDQFRAFNSQQQVGRFVRLDELAQPQGSHLEQPSGQLQASKSQQQIPRNNNDEDPGSIGSSSLSKF